MDSNISHLLCQNIISRGLNTEDTQCAIAMCNDFWEALHTFPLTPLKPVSCYARACDLPVLSDHWPSAVAELFSSLEDEKFQFEIHGVSAPAMRSLRPTEWIDDDIVYKYVGLIQSVNAEVHIAEPLDIPHWKKNLMNEKERFLFPIIHKGHWTFIHAQRHDDTLTVMHYDSGYGQRAPQYVQEWLNEVFPGLQIHYQKAPRNPMQEDSSSCGLFTLIGIRLIASGSQQLSQGEAEDIVPTLRVRILAELLAGKLNPSSDDCEEYLRYRARYRPPPPIPLPDLRKGSESPINLCTPSEKGSQRESTNAMLYALKPRHHSAPPIMERIAHRQNSPCASISLENNSSLAKKRRTQATPSETALVLAHEFGREESMLTVLKQAVRLYRDTTDKFSQEDLASLYTSVQESVSYETKKLPRHRYTHLRFAQKFHEIVPRGPNQRKYKKLLLNQLKFAGTPAQARKEWSRAVGLARRCEFWVQLIDFFQSSLGDQRLAALCGSSGTITAIEKMDRDVFFGILRERMRRQGSEIVNRLVAAGPLIDVLIHGMLPSQQLFLERDFSGLKFEDVVSLKAAPLKLALSITKA